MTHGAKSEPAPRQDRPATKNTLSQQLTRRRHAAQRSEPLDCGCSDPWICRCHDPELTDRQIEAAINAAEYLLAHKLPPLLTIPVRRALWRAGRRDLATITEVIA